MPSERVHAGTVSENDRAGLAKRATPATRNLENVDP